MEKTDGEYEIIIDDENFIGLHRIQPVAGKPAWKDPYLSVSCASEKMAVASTNSTFDIYIRGGK